MTTVNQNWNQRYQIQDTPWESGEAHSEIKRLFRAYIPKGQSVLEIGCGLGTNTQWLAQAGYKLTAIDISDIAINQAKTLAQEKNLSIDFHPMDFLNEWQKLSSFPVIFDCAVFQVFREDDLRKNFVKAVYNVLDDQGYWVNLSCNKADEDIIAAKTATKAPPSFSETELLTLVKPYFDIIEMHPCYFPIDRGNNIKANFNAWGSVFRRKVR